jgi:tetratricopeptide (TPR) repeat protein
MYFPPCACTKKILFFCVLILLSSTLQAKAKIYQIPDHFLEEIKVKKEIVEKNPHSAEAYFELAMSYSYTGQIEAGWAELKKVNDYDKEYAGKVIKKYGDLVAKDPQNWQYNFKLAFGYYFDEKKDLAEQQFSVALKTAPKNIWVMGFLALVKGENGQVEGAIDLCKKALKIEPNATAIHFLLGQALFKKGDYIGFIAESLITIRLKSEEESARKEKKDEEKSKV